MENTAFINKEAKEGVDELMCRPPQQSLLGWMDREEDFKSFYIRVKKACKPGRFTFQSYGIEMASKIWRVTTL